MKSIKETNKDAAVSPVVGVMLMLTVTIIIAAIVATFAGGMFSDTQQSSSLTAKVSNVDYATTHTPWGGGTLVWDDTDFKPGWNKTKYDDWGEWGTTYAPYNMTFTHKGGDKLKIDELTLRITSDGATYTTNVKDALVDTNVKTWSAGEPLKLTAYKKDGTDSSLKYGLSKASLLNGDADYYTWAFVDASGRTIATGTEYFNYPDLS